MLGPERRGSVFRHVVLWLVVSALSSACQSREPRTQVMLIIDADTEVRALGARLEVELTSRDAAGMSVGVPFSRVYDPMDSAGPSWPFSIAVVPRGGDAQRSYQLTATLWDTAEPIARLRVESGFVDRRTLELRARFTLNCLRAASLGCGEQETCEGGVCVDARVDAALLPSFVSSGAQGVVPTADGGLFERATSGWMPMQMSGVGVSAAPGDAAGSGAAGMTVVPAVPSAAGANAAGPAAAASCGDGRLDPGEHCDSAIAQGQPGACPTQCSSANPCEPATLEGTGCLAQCKLYPIAVVVSGDACCPAGADANTDTDCVARCGNGIIEAGETCDPVSSCPTQATCTSANVCLTPSVAGDAASCTATCVMRAIEACVAGDGCCPAACSSVTDSDCSASCGDGAVDANAGELCEPTSTTQPCPGSCDDGNACTVDYFTGSAKNCNLACTKVPTTVAVSGDACCPLGAHANIDSDCQPLCGNGVVERGELCDGRCPSVASCNDGNPCTADALVGSGCMRACSHVPVNTPAPGDSCCPAGANANNDSDCAPTCGNGVIEKGEICDGNCPRSCDDMKPCTQDVLMGQPGQCNVTCAHLEITVAQHGDGCCPNGFRFGADHDCIPVCGNGEVEGDELCDGKDCPSCDDKDACTEDKSVPGKDACHPKCTNTQVAADAAVADSCCPNGAGPTQDKDCAGCGNGVVEAGESCDPCDCPDLSDPCMKNELMGTACNVKCVPTAITAPKSGDGCCPTGANMLTDTDCRAVCGNRIVESQEECDEGKPDTPTCAGCRIVMPPPVAGAG